ncbi:hypothetical protein Leryth_027297 [Lithospermum erythrorhizon]|uniref:Uncharacterized protein n=1 Tax=Lithospermum erythrorhizon TaxID=34254 RepID=A0AAV3RQS8_LITER|nr:hypothetical protein Leryth_027297 [Lithospermum erythrorhizon]
MGRLRGKGTKQADPADDSRSREEEKHPVKRRGRPQKPLKDDTVDKEVEDLEDDKEDSEKAKGSVLKSETKVVENGRKRKKRSQINENADLVKKENEGGTSSMSNDSLKSVGFSGFRQNGSRRKNKPRRAAEVGVECI